MARTSLRVAVLYNAAVLPPSHPDAVSEADVVRNALIITRCLRQRGVKAWATAVRVPITRLVRSLSRRKPDVVFNLVESFAGSSAGEAWLSSLLELLRIPATGCPPEAQGLCRHKGRSKALLAGIGLPTAPFWIVGPHDPLPPWSGRPLFVKPESEDASLGIDHGSVVESPEALAARVDHVRRHHGPQALVETYLPGPEYNLAVLELGAPEVPAVAQIAYADPAPGHWPILTYAAKWDPDSPDDRASRVICPAPVEEPLRLELIRLALAAFQATACRDYARVDLRLDNQGRPMILEVNPNPDLGPDAGFARALRVSGRDYGATLEELVRQAAQRGASV